MKLLDFIVCDDIRLERGNKVTLVGVYDDIINIETKNTWPVPLKIAVYWKLQLDQEEKWFEEQVDLELNAFYNSEPLFKFEGKLEGTIDKTTRMFSVPFTGAIVGLKSTGTLTFNLVVKSSGKEMKRFDSPYEVTVRSKLTS
jgi:hypothetical protein